MNTKKRLLAVLLTALMLLQVYLPIHGAVAEVDLDAEEYQLGEITIESNYDSGDYDALLFKETPEEYLIMLDYRDIVTLGNLNYVKNGDIITINRHSYTVEINTDTAKANIYIENDSGKYPLYGEFTLDHIAEYENDGIKEIYLPMEQLFYLLNYTWFINDYTVYVMAPADTLLSFAGEFYEIAHSMPDFVSVLGDNVWEVLGSSAKYSVLSLVDELDLRVFSPQSFTNSKMESALLEMAAPVTSKLDDEQTKSFANKLSEYQQKEDEFVDSFLQAYDIAGDWPKALWELNGGSIAEWDSTFGDLGKALKGLKVTYTAYNIIKAAKTAADLPEYYMERIEYMTSVYSPNINDAVNKELNTAAENVINKYSSEFTAGVNAFKKQIASDVLDLAGAFAFGTAYTVVKCFKFAVSALKVVSPDFSKALESGDSMWLARSEHNIAHTLLYDYLSSLDSMLKYGVTAERMADFRLRAYQTLNAAGYCYYNIYKTKENEEDISADEYEDAAIDFAAYIQRLDDSLKYDESLILDTSFSNLNYEKDITSAADEHYGRPKVPEEYVCLPWKKAYADYLRDNPEGMGHALYYPEGQGRFALAMIDGDNIPELVIIGTEDTAGFRTYSEENDCVDTIGFSGVSTDIIFFDYDNCYFQNDGRIILHSYRSSPYVYEGFTIYKASILRPTEYLHHISLTKKDSELSIIEYDYDKADVYGGDYYYDILETIRNNPSQTNPNKKSISEKQYESYKTTYGFDKIYEMDQITSDEIYPLTLEGIKDALGIKFED